jgi:hypothetical protein
LDGNAATSAPVNVIVGGEAYVWGIHVLPGGQALFFFNPNFTAAQTGFGYTDDLTQRFTNLFFSFSPGLFVDERPPAASGRFYRATYKTK